MQTAEICQLPATELKIRRKDPQQMATCSPGTPNVSSCHWTGCFFSCSIFLWSSGLISFIPSQFITQFTVSFFIIILAIILGDLKIHIDDLSHICPLSILMSSMLRWSFGHALVQETIILACVIEIASCSFPLISLLVPNMQQSSSSYSFKMERISLFCSQPFQWLLGSFSMKAKDILMASRSLLTPSPSIRSLEHNFPSTLMLSVNTLSLAPLRTCVLAQCSVGNGLSKLALPSLFSVLCSLTT